MSCESETSKRSYHPRGQLFLYCIHYFTQKLLQQIPSSFFWVPFYVSLNSQMQKTIIWALSMTTRIKWEKKVPPKKENSASNSYFTSRYWPNMKQYPPFHFHLFYFIFKFINANIFPINVGKLSFESRTSIPCCLSSL